MDISPKIVLLLLFVLCFGTNFLINLFLSDDYFGVIPNRMTHTKLLSYGPRRVYKGKRLFKNVTDHSHNFSYSEIVGVNSFENWIVIVATGKPDTSIYDFRSRAEIKGTKWRCIVVLDAVGEGEGEFLNIRSENFVVLSRKEQEELIDSNPGYSSIQNISSHSLANKKNLGYLYAIRHGAKLIFDAHEDYRLTEEVMPYTDLLGEFVLISSSDSIFNPYKYYYSDPWGLLRLDGLPVRYTWNFKNLHYEVSKNYCTANRREVGVMQFMMKTKETPGRYIKQKFNKLPLVMKRGTLMPYDSHATLHHDSSFFGLHLPFSMKNSLADVMRAYYTQRLMWDINTDLAVTKPLMEYHLDAKSVLSSDEGHNQVSVPDYLITFLNEWQSKSNSLVERMEELAIEFYEKSFWDVEEVYSIHKWIRDLMMAGYKFPQISPALNEVEIPFHEEECQITDIRTQTAELYKDKVDTVKRGKLEMFLRMSAESSTLLDFYYLVFDWSLRFFWHNGASPLNLLLILDDEKEKDHKFGEVREKVYPFPTLHFEKPNSYYGTYGHSRMQWSMFWADQYATGDYVGFLDTDSLFISLVYEDLLFEGDKPIVWGLFGVPTHAWWGHVKSSTYKFLKEKEVVKAMNYFPVIVRVEHFAAVRHHIELAHGKPFNDVFRSMMFTKEYSQFNIMFTFLWYFHRDEYIWHMEESKSKNYDGPNELTEFHDVTDEMRTPYPKFSIHYRYIKGIKVKVDTWFNPKSINKAGLKTRNSLMLEGYCYSYGFNNTPEMCAKFNANAVQETLFEFEDHTWSWDERCLTVQQKHYSSLTSVEHKWDPDILATISGD